MNDQTLPTLIRVRNELLAAGIIKATATEEFDRAIRKLESKRVKSVLGATTAGSSAAPVAPATDRERL